MSAVKYVKTVTPFPTTKTLPPPVSEVPATKSEVRLSQIGISYEVSAAEVNRLDGIPIPPNSAVFNFDLGGVVIPIILRADCSREERIRVHDSLPKLERMYDKAHTAAEWEDTYGNLGWDPVLNQRLVDSASRDSSGGRILDQDLYEAQRPLRKAARVLHCIAASSLNECEIPHDYRLATRALRRIMQTNKEDKNLLIEATMSAAHYVLSIKSHPPEENWSDAGELSYHYMAKGSPKLKFGILRMNELLNGSTPLDTARQVISELAGESTVNAFIGNDVLPDHLLLIRFCALAALGASQGQFTDEHESMLISGFQSRPTEYLFNIQRMITSIDDVFYRQLYAEAAVFLEKYLDSVCFEADGRINKGTSEYIMHGYYDLGGKVDHRERIRADKRDMLHILVTIKREMAECVRSGMNEVEIVSMVAEKLHGRVVYSEFMTGGIQGTMAAGQFFEKRFGVCRHHALLFKMFMQEMGIPSLVVKGRYSFGGRHALNFVLLGERWHMVDLTNGAFIPYPLYPSPTLEDIQNKEFSVDTPLCPFQVKTCHNNWCIKEQGAGFSP